MNLLSDNFFARDSPSIQRVRGSQLRKILVSSGSVALIKSGQALSLRPDLLKNPIWASELSKLVDAVGSFSDMDAMNIMKNELEDLPIVKGNSQKSSLSKRRARKEKSLSKLEKVVAAEPVLSLFEFYNSNLAIASASIGQVYKAKIKRGPALETAIGKAEAAKWGGKIVAIKIQRPDVAASASLDMYLLRRTALWLSKFRGGDLVGIADTFGQQLFGELDYVREANNCERFRELYGDWDQIKVPTACTPLTRKRVLVMEWINGEKGPWKGKTGLDMVSLGLKCSVDQLLNTGLFHADPHRGNLLREKNGDLAFIDFGMMADVTEVERYGLIGLAIGLQTKDLPLITENLLKVCAKYITFVCCICHLYLASHKHV
jgi:predicted unusual protein kinase regulating ubiquinone biosynthesis (AarF/ABC1/UbiB family)